MPADSAQRSEQPTPRRKQKAREEGQIASSRELTAALQFALAVGMLVVWGGLAAGDLRRAVRGILAEAFRPSVTTESFFAMAAAVVAEPLGFVAALGLALLAVGVVVHMAQTGFALTFKRLAPDFKRLNPAQKLRELPADNLAQTAKALVLLPLAGWLFWVIVESELERFLTLPKMSLPAAAATVGSALGELLLKAALVLVALGFFDFWRQRRRIHKRLMMTRQEIKQEQKDLEGSPHVKLRLRRMQREIMRRRMMADVAQSTVVVTNPTHYAVALKFEPQTMAAPVVAGKGLDFLALRIREVAEQNGVPIVENPPLAQALYRATEIGSEIPENLYRAVAELLAYIFHLRQRL